MGCNEGSCGPKQGCCESSCCDSGCNQISQCETTNMMMQLANEAWADLMKEKMKKHFEKHNGAKMDKVAEESVKGCNAWWENKMNSKQAVHEFSENLKQAMMSK